MDAGERTEIEKAVLEVLVLQLESVVQVVCKYAYPSWRDFLMAMKEVGEFSSPFFSCGRPIASHVIHLSGV